MGSGGLAKARLKRLHDTMAAHVDRGAVPGVVTVVSRRGELHVEAVGEATLGGEPMRDDTIFRISSMTKPVTAVAAMILLEECRLRLDEPVDPWLPELADRRVVTSLDAPLDRTVPADRPITTRDLLTSCLGFGLVMAMPGTYPIQTAAAEFNLGQGPPSPQVLPDPDEWMRRLGSLPLMYQPGEQWTYDVPLDVLGVLVARVAGQSLPDFLRERIFDPLGMRDTGFDVPPASLDRLATHYEPDGETGEMAVYDAPDGQWSRPPRFPSGGGGLVSTAADYSTFAQMLLDGGRHGTQRILARPSVEAMTIDQLHPGQKAGADLSPGFFASHGWGFGVAVTTRRTAPSESIGAYGWEGGMGTSWRNDPKEQLFGVLLTQAMWSSPAGPLVYEDFWTGVYQAIDD